MPDGLVGRLLEKFGNLCIKHSDFRRKTHNFLEKTEPIFNPSIQMMSSAVDIDPTFKHALKLLHSSNTDSAEKIRNLLDELIKQRYGGNKTLNSTLSKKHLAEESTAPGSNLYVRKQKPAPVVLRAVSPLIVSGPDSKQQSPAKSDQTAEGTALESLTVPPPPSGSIIVSISDGEGNDEDDDVVMEEDQLKELEDLMCIVCKRMEHTARNRLVECADCHSLYHQECHKPVISEADANDQENAWFCTLCKGKTISKSSSSSSPAVGSSTKVSSSSSSSHSKSSSSKNYDSSSSSSSKHHKSSKSSKEGSSHDRDRDRDRDRERDRDRSDRDREKDKEKSSKSTSSGGGGSGSSGGGSSTSSSSANAGAGTPNINIISADKRLQMMKKKAAKLHDSKRKHK